MTALTTNTITTSTSNGSPAAIPMQYFPSPTGNESPPTNTTGGIAESGSSFAPTHTDSDRTPQYVSGAPMVPNFGVPPPTYPASSNRPVTTESSASSKKGAPEPETSSGSKVYVNTTMLTKGSRIFDRFLVRMPHTFIAMTLTFVPLYYGLGSEWQSFAYSATTFVGVGGTVYCFVRAFFFEILPEWMLEQTNKTKIWRRLMNITYTGFITVMFTTAVWKLPDLSTIQGLFFFGVSFGLPYIPLSQWYLDIDKHPKWLQQT